jgi:hypothetical protein
MKSRKMRQKEHVTCTGSWKFIQNFLGNPEEEKPLEWDERIMEK